MIRLIIAEDSPTICEMLVNLLKTEEGIDVIATAGDGKEVIELVKIHHPNIVLMDINMPLLNGLEASKIIMQSTPVPILLMSATWEIKELKEVVEGMKIGVLGIYEKPYGLGHPQFEELYSKLVLAIRLMSEIKVVRQFNHDITPLVKSKIELKNQKLQCSCRCVVIGSSTGGPPVLHTILKSLPADYPNPILVAQHMSSDFISSFIQWLNDECDINIKLACDGERIEKGNVYFAPSNYHLTLNNNRINLIKAEKKELNIPSVSKLFASVNDAFASDTVAILLSGMGNDGSAEISKLRKNGAVTIGQNELSSIVFGMANEAKKLDGLEFILSPEEILELLLGLKCSTKELQ